MNPHTATIIDPYFVVPEACDDQCKTLQAAAREALFSARKYPGTQYIVIASRHGHFGWCNASVYMDGPGVYENSLRDLGTARQIAENAQQKGAQRKDWTAVFPSHSCW